MPMLVYTMPCDGHINCGGYCVSSLARYNGLLQSSIEVCFFRIVQLLK